MVMAGGADMGLPLALLAVLPNGRVSHRTSEESWLPVTPVGLPALPTGAIMVGQS